MGFKSPGTADCGGHILNLSFFVADIHIIFGCRALVGLLKKNAVLVNHLDFTYVIALH